MLTSLTKTIRPEKIDWRIVVLLAGLAFGLSVSVPLLPVYLKLTAVVIPFVVFATAACTYWMMTGTPHKSRSTYRAQIPQVNELSQVSPKTVEDLFDYLPIALMRICKNGDILQTN